MIHLNSKEQQLLFKWIIIHLNSKTPNEKKTKCMQWNNKCDVKRMYEAYLVTETDEDNGDETSAQDWWCWPPLLSVFSASPFGFLLFMFLCSYSYLLIRLSFAFPSVLSTLLPFLSLMLSPSLFFLLFLSASPFFFLFFYKAREGFVLVGRLDNSREPCPVIETISAFNDETSSFILLLKPLLRRRWWTVVHETSLFLQFKWPFWFGPCGFTICNQTPG